MPRLLLGHRRLPNIDDRWKPSKAKFLINFEDANQRIVIHADPARGDAWRAEPFISTLRVWARRSLDAGGMLMVWTGQRATIVLPDREIELGHVRDDQFIVRVPRMTPRGPAVDFVVRNSSGA